MIKQRHFSAFDSFNRETPGFTSVDIQQHIREFKRGGGKVQKIPSGVVAAEHLSRKELAKRTLRARKEAAK